MIAKSKKLKLIFVIFFWIAIVFFLWVFIKIFFSKEPREKFFAFSENYKIVAVGVLQFDNFRPVYLTKGSNVIWYGINPATKEFYRCPKKQMPEISFFPKKTDHVWAPILSVDIIDGLQCDDKTDKCYYKNIRILVGSFADILRPNVYYATRHDIQLNYVIYCCDKNERSNLAVKVFPLQNKIYKIKQN